MQNLVTSSYAFPSFSFLGEFRFFQRPGFFPGFKLEIFSCKNQKTESMIITSSYAFPSFSFLGEFRFSFFFFHLAYELRSVYFFELT
jgi:hypothetical protein